MDIYNIKLNAEALNQILSILGETPTARGIYPIYQDILQQVRDIQEDQAKRSQTEQSQNKDEF